jgi:hypothetical protein
MTRKRINAVVAGLSALPHSLQPDPIPHRGLSPYLNLIIIMVGSLEPPQVYRLQIKKGIELKPIA